MLENVKNFALHDSGKTLKTVKDTLDEVGCNVYYSVLNAVNYGVPQKRERIFFVCFRKDLNIKYDFPKPIKLKKHLCDVLLSDEETKDYAIDRNDIITNDSIVEHFTNTSLRLGSINKGGQGERIYSAMGLAITLSAYGGGVGAKTGLYLVNGKVRRLSPRECARIDGFPDTFKIPTNKNVAYKQFGNSIVIDVLQYIIKSVLKCSNNGRLLY